MSDAETRLHFRIGYLGDAFHGSQIQPDVRTVQGELIHAFQKLGWIQKQEDEHNLVLSSRTDAGVHVRLNGGTVRVATSLWESITPRKFVRAVDASDAPVPPTLTPTVPVLIVELPIFTTLALCLINAVSAVKFNPAN